MDETFGRKATKFYINLKKPVDIPGKIEIINPYEDNKIKETIKKFYDKFFNDTSKRIFIFGINPGRFGGGITGINFTDPVALSLYCGIDNNFGNRRELSSQFVYEFINAFGGTEKFYKKFFISAVYPLAILKDGKNFNFYDNKKIYGYLKPAIVSYMKKQIEFGAKQELAISMGKKNFVYLRELNNEIKYFKK
ncbi:MAG: DUF4918 family protein, partial [Ignavibacteriaceae bacterium]